MRRAYAKFVEEYVEDGSYLGLGVTATCQECYKSETSYGVSDKSKKRCMVILAKQCDCYLVERL